MASLCVTTTPPLLSRQPVPQHLRARNRIVQHTPDQGRPSTPRFLDQSLSVSGVFGNVVGSATCSAQPGPSRLVLSTLRQNSYGKRAAEVIDLTHTTGGLSDTSSARQPKRARTVNNLKPSKTTTLATKVNGVDRRSKARRDKAEQQDKLTAESISWRQKYKKAFPTFVFYFDAIDPVTEGGMVKAVERLGANVDNFFSKKVTHVITSRAVPPSGKENVNSPALPTLVGRPGGSNSGVVTLFESSVGPMRTKRIKQSPTRYALPDGQKLQQLDVLEKNPFIDSKDILSKASEFGLKIWRLEKAELIVTRMNSYSPAKTTTATTRTLSLPSLLRDEQLFGTRERDPFVPRLDTHYFAPKSCYVLVEDSTGEHRPVVTKEYERPRRGEDPAWPVLWGGIEGRGGFYRYEGPAIKYERRLPPPVLARPVLAAIQPTGFAGVAARAVGGAGAADLRRTVSLSNLRKNQPVRQGALPEPLASKPAYIAASGNSQTITSNIASSTRSGALVPGGLSGMPDKRLAILERSMVSMGKGGLSKRLVPGKLRRSTSVDAGLNVKAPAPRSEPKKPGYCENCRIKYDDFKEHVVARKHRKFALNDANWTDLDILLERIGRPLAPQEVPDSAEDFGEGDSGFYDGEEECMDEDLDEEDEQ